MTEMHLTFTNGRWVASIGHIVATGPCKEDAMKRLTEILYARLDELRRTVSDLRGVIAA